MQGSLKTHQLDENERGYQSTEKCAENVRHIKIAE